MTKSISALQNDRLRDGLLGLYVFGVLGLGIELILLGHTEDAWQWVPLVLIPLGVLASGWARFSPGAESLKVFQAIMLLYIVGGILGLWLHFKGNMEFELEMYPSLSDVELVWESLTGATPALSPGAMTVFGLLGLLWTLTHHTLDATTTSD